MAFSERAQQVRDQLIQANHVLAQHGVVDAFGHISARNPDDANRYFLSGSRAPEQVTLDDLIEFTLDGEPTSPQQRPMYAERAIHSRIYARRPDVRSVCHNHAPATVPFGVTGVPLRAIWHVAAVIGREVPVWDIRPEFGSTDLLVTTRAQGDSLALALGENRSILMRGHGSTVVAGSIREAVMTAIYLQENAKLLSTSLGMSGEIVYLDPDEVEHAAARQFSPLALDRAWNAWVSRLER